VIQPAVGAGRTKAEKAPEQRAFAAARTAAGHARPERGYRRLAGWRGVGIGLLVHARNIGRRRPAAAAPQRRASRRLFAFVFAALVVQTRQDTTGRREQILNRAKSVIRS